MGVFIQSGHRTRLERLDAIIFEQHLKESLYRMVPFESHSIMFPRKNSVVSPSWSEAEKRLLLPIPSEDGGVLGIFVARGAAADIAERLVPLWKAVSPLVSENLLNFKRSLCDPVTGLYTRHYLLTTLERDLDVMRFPSKNAEKKIRGEKEKKTSGNTKQMEQRLSGALSMTQTVDGSDVKNKTEDDFPRRGCSGVLVIRLAALRDVVREFGYQFADELMTALADALVLHCPEQAVAARTGDSEFAVGLRSATRKSASKLASVLIDALGKVYIEHPLRKERVAIQASIGFSLFPQDMGGADFLKSSPEQARILLRKARLAAALANEDDGNGSSRIMGFGKILAEGGRVLQVLPLSRVLVSLGANMHAREGLRFSVWAMQSSFSEKNSRSGVTPIYKGEIALMDVHANTSQAETLHVGDPSWNLEPGDRLVLLPEEQSGSKPMSLASARRDPATGLLRHGDFLAQWSASREQNEDFLLTLIRIAPFLDEQLSEEKISDAGDFHTEQYGRDVPGLASHPDQVMAEVTGLLRESFGQDVLGGRYGLHSLIVFHPNVKAEQVAVEYEKLSELVKSRLHLDTAVGIAPHPFLDFRKADALENCRKALEYALLLPMPHIGILDSLAINVSADKRFSQGDTFTAIKEYQRALLANEKNAIAWNSLGICYAGLGRGNEAEEYFLKALECEPKDPMALYNLGFICRSRGETEKASTYFHSCLQSDPDHLFALIRLGQMAEHSGDQAMAKKYFIKAAKKPGGEGVTFRHFARLALASGNEEEAREHLHSALLHDPHDAVSLYLLAQVYLDAEEDPDMALALARQSVSLRPELKAGWLALSRAFEAMGKTDQALEAKLRSGHI